jgi:alpha-tubulin suppressor-like RCC1 family protein
MRNTPCVAVAAGEKHSVALSQKGEVYVWGDNTSGQLGVPRRSGIQKVQRVEALWNGAQPKIVIAIAAAEQSTLVLTSPTPGLTHVNSIYSWGHGNHVPIRVHFENHFRGNSEQQQQGSLLAASRRVVNPVAIACAKYHNAAITSDGHVYTWGLHAESLGRTNAKGSPKQSHQRNSTSGRSTSSPQLVTGMLPENGGGFAVVLSASEQHTAVVTDTGALYTWGTTHGKNVLGHEGVRWQPSPKRVPGVHRAVNVAVAKEHTVLLIGASFPTIPKTTGLSNLELLSARKVAEYVDLFNVVPILIMAERTEVRM